MKIRNFFNFGDFGPFCRLFGPRASKIAKSTALTLGQAPKALRQPGSRQVNFFRPTSTMGVQILSFGPILEIFKNKLGCTTPRGVGLGQMYPTQRGSELVFSGSGLSDFRGLGSKKVEKMDQNRRKSKNFRIFKIGPNIKMWVSGV